MKIEFPRSNKEKKDPVTLQKLIENAMKHDVVSNETPLTISISIVDSCLDAVNSVNKKLQVETRNRQGKFEISILLPDRSVHGITEPDNLFRVRISLI